MLCWVCWAIVMTLLQIVLSFVSSYSVLRYVLPPLMPVPVIFNRPPSHLPQVRSCPPELAHSLWGTGCVGGNCYGQDIQVTNNNLKAQ